MLWADRNRLPKHLKDTAVAPMLRRFCTGGGLVVGIVLLAMVAAFLALRLYMVLGKRSGHEQALPPTPAEERVAPAQLRTQPEVVPEAAQPSDSLIDPSAATGVRALLAADNSFDVARFLDGAKSAYRMILEAFWRGDEEELSWLVGPEVRDAFGHAIAERREAGHTLDNRVVSIESARIENARLEGKVALVTVRFVADIAAVTRDAEGNVIAGTLEDAVSTDDYWTFSRNLKDADPNWVLVETDEAA